MALGLPDDPAQQRRLLIGLVPLLALFGYWYFLHGDYVQDLEAQETRLESLEVKNAQARIRAPQSLRLEERLTEFERHIERLEELVPRGEEVSRLLNTINERADQIGITMVRFAPRSTESGTHYDRQTYQLTVQGTYHQFARFLSEIGSLPRIITPIDVAIMPLTDDVEPGRARPLESSFLIETYVMPETRPAVANEGGADD